VPEAGNTGVWHTADLPGRFNGSFPQVTVDFSHVIPPAHLDAQVELLKLNQAGRV
jgi:hypothetical protein